MDDSLVHHHFGVQPGVLGDEAGHLAVVHVCPVHPAAEANHIKPEVLQVIRGTLCTGSFTGGVRVHRCHAEQLRALMG